MHAALSKQKYINLRFLKSTDKQDIQPLIVRLEKKLESVNLRL